MRTCQRCGNETYQQEEDKCYSEHCDYNHLKKLKEEGVDGPAQP